jgi:acyl-CoA thioesterase FadM
MPRIKLKPLKNYPFTFEISVRTTDLNYGGHLGNDKLLSLIHEARVAFLASHGFTEIDCAGVSLIMGDVIIVYRGEAFANDRLRFEVAASEPSRSGFRLFYRISCLPGKAPIALAENGMVCFNYETHRLELLPEALRAICI